MRKHVKQAEVKLRIRFVACTNEDVIIKEYDQLLFQETAFL